MEARCVVNGGVEKSKAASGKFPLTAWEVATASGVVLSFVIGLVGVYLTMPVSDYSFLKLPRSLEDLQILRCFFLIWDGWGWLCLRCSTIIVEAVKFPAIMSLLDAFLAISKHDFAAGDLSTWSVINHENSENRAS